MATTGKYQLMAAAILSLAFLGLETQTGHSFMVEGMAHLRLEFGRLTSALPGDKPLEGAGTPKRRLTVQLPMNHFGHGGSPADLFERREPAAGNVFGEEADTDLDQQLLKVGKSGAVAPAIMRQAVVEPEGADATAWR